MKTSWQTETGHLIFRFSEIGQSSQYNLNLIQEYSTMQSAYLPSVPDFASHSPFGGAFWFLPHVAYGILHRTSQ